MLGWSRGGGGGGGGDGPKNVPRNLRARGRDLRLQSCSEHVVHVEHKA